MHAEISSPIISHAFRAVISRTSASGSSFMDATGVVHLPTVRMRREVRAVGLDEYPLYRNTAHHLCHPRGILKGYNAGKRDVPAHIHKLSRHLRTAAEAVQYASHTLVLLQHIETIAVCVAVVYLNRDIELACKAELHIEPALLRLAWDIPVIIESYLAEQANAVASEQLGECFKLRRLVRTLGRKLLGMDARRSIDMLVRECEIKLAAGRLYRRSRSQYAADAVLAERTGKVLLTQRAVVLGRCVELCIA